MAPLSLLWGILPFFLSSGGMLVLMVILVVVMEAFMVVPVVVVLLDVVIESVITVVVPIVLSLIVGEIWPTILSALGKLMKLHNHSLLLFHLDMQVLVLTSNSGDALTTQLSKLVQQLSLHFVLLPLLY